MSNAWMRKYACGVTRIVVIDNYDSFTFNLVQYLGELGADVRVVPNDATTPEALLASAPDGILLSPGPGTPDDAGICLAAIAALAGKIPILGVCLGHQAIGQAFGARVVRAVRLMHGRSSPVSHDGTGLFRGLPNPLDAGRYHSLLVERETLPACFVVSAWTSEGEIMGLRHETLDLEGVQFHPESILTPRGKELLGRWLSRLARGGGEEAA